MSYGVLASFNRLRFSVELYPQVFFRVSTFLACWFQLLNMENPLQSTDFSKPIDTAKWPHPRDLDVVNPRSHLGRFARAPWFNPVGLAEPGLVELYANAQTLPDQVPLEAVDSRDWRLRCSAPDRVLFRRFDNRINRRVSAEVAREDFVLKVYQRMHRVEGGGFVDQTLSLDAWQFRDKKEAVYGKRLAGVFSEHAKEWISHSLPVYPALCIKFPLLPAEFRFVSRKSGKYIGEAHLDFLRWERRTRQRLGFLVPYQCLEVYSFLNHTRRNRYVPVPASWKDYEVPLGMVVEIPWVLTYLGVELMDPSSGAWVVFYTEWVTFVAVALLWEVYDTFRLFWLPPAIIAGIRSLKLSKILGAPENYEECLSLLKVIENTNWTTVSGDNRRRKIPADKRDSCPISRTDAGGDFIWYDPWKGVEITREQVYTLRANRPTMPPDHPTGYRYFKELPDAAWNVGSPKKTAENAPKVADDAAMEVDIPHRGDTPPHPPSEDLDEIQKVGQPRASSSGGGSEGKRPKLSGSSLSSAVAPPDLVAAVKAAASSGNPVISGRPVSPSPSSALGSDIRKLGFNSGDPQVDTDGSRLRFLQSVLRSAGITSIPGTVEKAVALLSSLNEKKKQDTAPSTVRPNAVALRSVPVSPFAKMPNNGHTKDNEAINPEARTPTPKSSASGLPKVITPNVPPMSSAPAVSEPNTAKGAGSSGNNGNSAPTSQPEATTMEVTPSVQPHEAENYEEE